ncbi:hypothetical protein KY495_04440 [Massilia sp. PAMC28688]|uniref:BPSS1780 family membrane protein n=1 Tax=Massilia sp. PAMC28688 TaxID=2861283 RepID=UPI001C6278AF|nr:BPSS1780 family membrane protein [Massilia sp. PAMC28688]QYF94471.1 hypothetical protein KY495_04440 [Massilia sp. PAMC28688]
MSSLPARTGLEWLKQGFGLFRQQPGILTMLLFANFLGSVLLSAVPVIGTLATIVLIPVFSIAIMQACNLIAQGQRVMPDVLLTGFRKPAVTHLLKLGMVYVGVALIMFIAMRLSVDESAVQQMQASAEAAKAASQAGTPVTPPQYPGTLLFLVLLWSIVMLLMSFATPLTYWKEMPLLKAIFYSVFGVVGAFKPILVMLLSAMGMFMVLILFLRLLFGGSALVFQAVIAWSSLMFTLVLQCAMFASYRQIFGDPAPGIKPPVVW